MSYSARLSLVTALVGVSLSMPAARAQAPATAPPTAEALVAKAVEAQGGLERMRAVRSFRLTGSLSTPDMPVPVTTILLAKRPNLSRQEVVLPGGNLVIGFDGVQAWKIDPGAAAPVAVTGDQVDTIEQQSDFDGPLVDYKAKGSSVEYVGAEMFAGASVHHVKVTDKKGRVQHCYLDAQTSLPVRIVSRMGPAELEQQLSDYRAVSGIKLPFKLRSLTAGRVAATITITKVEFDVPLEDAVFKMK